ncbi:MAG: ribonuclease R, partial [Pseudoxanthomonas sp.]
MTKKPTKGGSKPASGKPGKPSGSAKKAPGAKKSKLPPWMPDLPAGPPSKAAKPAQSARGPRGGSRQPAAPQRGNFRDPHAAREAERYADPIASREAILGLLSGADGPLTAEDLAGKLQLTAPERFDALGKRLGAMVRDGQLLQNRRGGFAPAKQMDLIPGVVIANPNGFGFLRPEAGGGDDLFLPPYEMRKAMHGDRVMACVTGVDRSGRREGSIVEVLERRLSRLIGRYSLEGGISYLIPDDKRVQRNVQIPQEGRGEARDGQLVVVELTQAPDARRPPIGKVVAVLGDKLTPSLVVEAAIHGHEIPHEFPQEVLDEAAAVPLVVEESMVAGRVDLRDMPLVTIDGADA